MTKETVLVAGAAGFVGSHLTEALLRSEKKVIGLDSLTTGVNKNIDILSNYDDFEFVEQDISKPFTTKQRIHEIYNFASPASPTDFESKRIDILRAGSLGTINLLDLAKTKKAKYIFASSSEVYGDPLKNPQAESYNGNVNTTGIRSIYDESKRWGEAAAMAYNREFGLSTRIVRIFNTYGERMNINDGRAIPTFIKQAILNENITLFGDGNQTRSPQYISDLVSGVLALSESNVIEPINIGNPVEMTIKQIADKIKDLSNSKSKIVYSKDLPQHDPKVRKPDIAKAQRLLSWTPEVDSDEGFTKTIVWFRSELDGKKN